MPKLKNSWEKKNFSTVSGNIIELYDFILFAYFSKTIAILFFPQHNLFAGILFTLTIFAVGNIVRPLGSILMGWLGDEIGRRKTLIVSISIITISTTMIGLLPTYHSIGILAPILLTCCRLAQGLSMSGEQMGAAIFLSESAPKNKIYTACAWIMGSVYFGLFIGSVFVFTLTASLSDTFLLEWGWRIPFISSSILGLIAITLRYRQEETETFTKLQKDKKLVRTPLKIILREYKLSTLSNILLASNLAVLVYLFSTYIPTFIKSNSHIPALLSMSFCSLSFFAAGYLVIQVGIWSDKYGYKRPLISSAMGSIIFAYPIFYLINMDHWIGFLIAQMSLAILIALAAGALIPVMIKSYPPNVRFSGLAISFNFSMTIFGGTAPVIAHMLTKVSSLAPAYCLVYAGIFFLIGHYIRLAQLAGPKNNQVTSTIQIQHKPKLLNL